MWGITQQWVSLGFFVLFFSTSWIFPSLCARQDLDAYRHRLKTTRKLEKDPLSLARGSRCSLGRFRERSLRVDSGCGKCWRSPAATLPCTCRGRSKNHPLWDCWMGPWTESCHPTPPAAGVGNPFPLTVEGRSRRRDWERDSVICARSPRHTPRLEQPMHADWSQHRNCFEK